VKIEQSADVRGWRTNNKAMALPETKTKWLRPKDLPFSRGHTYRLIAEGLIFSAELRVPGSSRSIRLIDGDSLDRYLTRLGKEQQAQREKQGEVK
jgi:hypothetical protein